MAKNIVSGSESIAKISQSLGLLETTGFTPGIVALDSMEKSEGIAAIQLEINDFLGIILKIVGDLDSVESAIKMGHRLADQMKGDPRSTVIANPDKVALKAIESAVEYNGLIQQEVVVPTRKENMNTPPPALGFIETQGFTAVFQAIDSACKAANVEVVGKEKLGGGYVTVVIQGDVAAVSTAIDVGREQVGSLGNLIAAHIVTRPSQSVLGLLPRLEPV